MNLHTMPLYNSQWNQNISTNHEFNDKLPFWFAESRPGSDSSEPLFITNIKTNLVQITGSNGSNTVYGQRDSGKSGCECSQEVEEEVVEWEVEEREEHTGKNRGTTRPGTHLPDTHIKLYS